jgi:hypothetical protein
MQSILPETYEENLIEGMLPGDTGYTVPWAMWADKNRKLWINRKYTIHDTPGGTVALKIKMLRGGIVQVYSYSIGKHKYTPGESSWDHTGVGLPVQLVNGS